MHNNVPFVVVINYQHKLHRRKRMKQKKKRKTLWCVGKKMLHLLEKCVGWLATCMGGHFNDLANTQKFVVNEDNDLSKIRDGHVRRGLVFS